MTSDRRSIAGHQIDQPPQHDVAHFSKLFDIHMMCWGTGQERTEAQYKRLLEDAGWRAIGGYYPSNRLLGVIVGACA
jgi:hypothetical protein